MKKLLIVALCLFAAAGCGKEAKNITYDSGVTYKQYIEKYTEAVEVLREEDSFIDAFFLDVDNDKEPELLELVEKEEGIGSKVYAYFDGNMVRMDEFEDCVFDFGENKSEPWTGEDGKQYFYKSLRDGNEGINELYYFDGGIAIETAHSCEKLGSESYIDGEPVSEDEYYEHIEKDCPKKQGALKKKTFNISKNKDKGEKLEKYWR